MKVESSYNLRNRKVDSESSQMSEERSPSGRTSVGSLSHEQTRDNFNSESDQEPQTKLSYEKLTQMESIIVKLTNMVLQMQSSLDSIVKVNRLSEAVSPNKQSKSLPQVPSIPDSDKVVEEETVIIDTNSSLMERDEVASVSSSNSNVEVHDYITCDEDQTEEVIPSGISNSQRRTSSQNFGNVATSFIPINQINPPKFDGDKSQAKSWLRQYEDTMNINGYDNHQKLIRARAYLSGEAAQWLTAKHRLDRKLNWARFKVAFYRHFCGIDSMAILRRKLEESKQRNDEHPSAFLVRTIDLCEEFDHKMSDDQIVQKIAQGLNTYTYNTLAAVKDRNDWTIDWISKRFEQFKMAASELSSETQLSNKATLPRSNSNSNAQIPPKSLAAWVCFNCDSTGHLIKDCAQQLDDARIKANCEAYRAQVQAKKASSDASATQLSLNRVKFERAKNQAPTLVCDTIPKPNLTVNINGKEVTGRVDTGSDITAFPRSLAQELNLSIQPWIHAPLKPIGSLNVEVHGATSILATIRNTRRALLIAIIDDKYLQETLWGNDFISSFSLFDYGKLNSKTDTGSVEINAVSTSENLAQHPLDKTCVGEVPSNIRTLSHNTLIQHQDVFSRDDEDIGRTKTTSQLAGNLVPLGDGELSQHFNRERWKRNQSHPLTQPKQTLSAQPFPQTSFTVRVEPT